MLPCEDRRRLPLLCRYHMQFCQVVSHIAINRISMQLQGILLSSAKIVLIYDRSALILE
jgi:hypothetical protein